MSKKLREQFEEETGNNHITEVMGRYNPVYVEWLEQRQEAAQHETPAPKWETPDEFGLYEIFDDGSFQFLHDILFWALIPTNSKNEIHLCGVDESGLYGYDLEIEDRYDTGWSLDDVEYCMRYEQKG